MDSFRSGDGLCAWPGCPMGHGYDETGEKGVILLTMGETPEARFVPLDVPHFYDEELEVGADAVSALENLLPGVPSEDFYRVTLTGYADNVDLQALTDRFGYLKNLVLRDKTIPEKELWSAVGEDTLEGTFFTLLYDELDTESGKYQNRIKLAAKIARQILDGQEVTLP